AFQKNGETSARRPKLAGPRAWATSRSRPQSPPLTHAANEPCKKGALAPRVGADPTHFGYRDWRCPTTGYRVLGAARHGRPVVSVPRDADGRGVGVPSGAGLRHCPPLARPLRSRTLVRARSEEHTSELQS